MTTPHITQLREHLMETLAALRDRENPMDVDRARAVAQVAGVLVDSAKVEVDYIKATGQESAQFLEQAPQITSDASQSGVPSEGHPLNGITSITRHRLRG
jgi:BioD-like phosphotransacetylase family protein